MFYVTLRRDADPLEMLGCSSPDYCVKSWQLAAPACSVCENSQWPLQRVWLVWALRVWVISHVWFVEIQVIVLRKINKWTFVGTDSKAPCLNCVVTQHIIANVILLIFSFVCFASVSWRRRIPWWTNGTHVQSLGPPLCDAWIMKQWQWIINGPVSCSVCLSV